MKFKSILIISIVALITFLIYLSTIDKKVYFLSLGDEFSSGVTPYGGRDYGYNDYIKDHLKERGVYENYINEFINEGSRIIDLIRDVEDNKKVLLAGKNRSLKNALIKSDLITISIGYNDLSSKIGIAGELSANFYQYVDEIMNDMNLLFEKIRHYCKEDIVVLGYIYPPIYIDNDNVKLYFEYANSKLEQLAQRYKMMFIDVSDINNNLEYLPNPNRPFPTKKGYQLIYERVKEQLNKSLFARTTHK